MKRIASLIGCTEGQLWTLGITAVLVAVLTLGGVVPVLQYRPAVLSAAPALQPAVSGPATAAPTPVVASPQARLAPHAALPLTPPAALRTPSPTPAPPPASVEEGMLPPVAVTDVPVLVQAGWTGPLTDGTTTPSGDLGLGNELVSQTVSYVEIAWTGRTVSVSFDPGATINRDASVAAAEVCPITAGTWTPPHGTGTAPSYDCRSPVEAMPTSTGFALDLRAVPIRGGLRSFALVPVGTAPFHVALLPRVFP